MIAIIFIGVISYNLMLSSAIMITPRTIALPAGYCLTTEERESVLNSLKRNISNILSKLIVPQCGDGLWHRVAYINMSDSTQECPSNWTEISTPVRTCGRPTSAGPSCPGVYFSTSTLQYSKVCGRAIGYQDGSADGFRLFGQPTPTSADAYYVDGLSITHGGMPRTHIWTYAVGNSDATIMDYSSDCHCANPNATVEQYFPPGFVGDSYFCESGNHGTGLGHRTDFLEDDPVWDGEQCEGICCSNGKSPPWFSVTLPDPTVDDIEVRICSDESTNNEDTPIQLLEIYIQ